MEPYKGLIDKASDPDLKCFHLVDTQFFSEYQEYKISEIATICLYCVTNLMLNMTLETVPTSFQSGHFDDIVKYHSSYTFKKIEFNKGFCTIK